MAVDPALLQLLVCPKCHKPLALVHDDTGLKCPECHRVYPIKDDLPVMLIDEATIEP
jgi:uncharacterized protein YbaR (Trm112 family)